MAQRSCRHFWVLRRPWAKRSKREWFYGRLLAEGHPPNSMKAAPSILGVPSYRDLGA